MKLPKAILLDLDNTVYEYAPCQQRAMETAQGEAAAVRKEWSTFEVFSKDYDAGRAVIQKLLPGHAASHCRLLYFKTMVEMMFGSSQLRLATRLHNAFWQGYFEAMRIDEGCAAKLESWRTAGVKLAWVTNFTTETQVKKLEKIGLAEATDFLITSEEAGADKPSPLPFQLAMKKLNVRAQDCVMIGDDWKSDVEPSLALGIAPIFRRRDSKQIAGHVSSFDRWEELSALFS